MDPAAEAAAKARAEARVGTEPGAGLPSGHAAPVIGRGWEGIRDTSRGPSDSTGAIGTTRYIELVNSRFAIYNRTNDAPLFTGTLGQLGGVTGNFFDPQIIWDPTTSRFYYTFDNVVNAQTNQLPFGFSKTASPNNANSWCKYLLNYGSEFPDYPKLGDTRDFILIGANVFGANDAFLRTDVAWVTKPPAGSTCPDPASFLVGAEEDLRNANGSSAWTPVPAIQTDTDAKGWVVATQCCSGNFLSVFQVTRNQNGTARFGPGRNVSVANYDVPTAARQPGTNRKIDTSDTRLTQAVSAIDPSQGAGDSVAVWTQHTVEAGNVSRVRWYEIDPVARALFQTGTISHGNQTWAFNGAISPDRKVSGNTERFGTNMVIGYNTSSNSQLANILVRPKVGAGAISGPVLVTNSIGVLNDFTCNNQNVCRWGDYAAATPDPAAPSGGAVGAVWLTSQAVAPDGGGGADWTTVNWSITP